MNPDCRLTDFTLDELRALHFAVIHTISEIHKMDKPGMLENDLNLLQGRIQVQIMDAIVQVKKMEIVNQN